MSQCMGECCEYGGCGTGDSICYTVEETVGFSDNQYVVDDSETCDLVNGTYYNCATACVQDFEENTSNCLESYCSYAG